MAAPSKKKRPKRLTPTPETLRELYSLSGNRCAFPDCSRTILNDAGEKRGQICHIEAAMPGGERFNDASTDEERRHVSNLLLLCYEHHLDTDDVAAYPVGRMRKMKEDHESRFRAGWLSLVDEVKDWTQGAVVQTPTHMSAFFVSSGMPDDLTEEEKEESRADVLAFAAALRTLTLPARQTLYVIVNRGVPDRWNTGNFSVLPSELADATVQTMRQVVDRVSQLENAGFAIFDQDPDEIEWFTTRIPDSLAEWPTWSDFKTFCSDPESLRDLIVDLQFAQLD
ncbi:MAG: hypothetical protein JHC70_05095 [Rhodococcus sp.]|nr:hypothetical protein [Rhodococcus sp. (in: high G+C Gram-positive bacteria)]MBJ7321704.1 hypothetical protein [Rhodococcus sp. (in: high G+C Gram-positive bacteria)]